MIKKPILKSCARYFIKGFTLVELMITVTVVTMISAVVLFENSKFNSTVLLTNLSYEVALTSRQAQVFGLSSRAAGGLTQIAYGIYFDLDNPYQFILFADTNNSGGNKFSYQSGESINIANINNRNYLSDICTLSGTSWTCSTGSTLRRVSIAFLRPNPEPEFRDSTNQSSPVKISVDAIKLVFKNINNNIDKRCTLLTLSGQISVKSQAACDATNVI